MSNSNISFNSIALKTNGEDEDLNSTINVNVNGVNAICLSDCYFEFSQDFSPKIYSVEPDNFTRLNTELNINGVNFGEEPGKVHVNIGMQNCNVTYANNTNVFCMLQALSLGPQRINVLVDGNKFIDFLFKL